jgi:hypothetical protein
MHCTGRKNNLGVLFCILLFFVFAGYGVRASRLQLTQIAGQTPVNPEHPSSTPTFYRDVLPILGKHCQRCHNPSGIAPMPFDTYDQVRGYANVIRNVTQDKAMPPPFAIPEAGRVREDLSLTPEEISTIAAWAKAKAPPGNPRDAISSAEVAETTSRPDMILKLPAPISYPSADHSDYTYEIVPTHFKEDRWVQMAKYLSDQPKNVRQAVVFIRSPNSTWLRHAPVGIPFGAITLTHGEENDPKNADILVVYAAGSPPAKWAASMAKLIPAGADLVFRLQYVATDKGGADQSGVGLTFSKQRPRQQVITLQLTKDHLSIPSGASDYRVEARGTLTNDAVLLSFFPDMRRLGKRFQYDLIHASGNRKNEPSPKDEVLLRVAFDLRWQTSYTLIKPQMLKAGTTLRAVAWYDNSANNLRNANPGVSVGLGDKYGDEASAGFFDIAVPAGLNKHRRLIR